MALETDIIEFPFEAGQNEGVDRAVLPLPQLSSLRNARYRKGRQLGKRNGYSSVSSLDAAGVALGGGDGRLTCLGPSFCVVDDRFYRRDFQSDNWQLPPTSYSTGAIAGTRLFGKFPQFMPAPSYEVLNVQSDLNTGGIAGTANPSVGGMTTALGHVWVCASFYSVSDTSWLIRVAAIDPNTGAEVRHWDIDPGGGGSAPASVTQFPILLSTSNGTVVLIYDHHTAGVKDGVRVRTLTSIASGFGSEVSFACIESAANYDPSSSTGILFIYTLTGSPATATIARMDPTTMVATDFVDYSTGGNKTLLSIFGKTSGLVWIGLTDAANGLLTRAYDATLTSGATSSNWATRFADAVGPIMYADRTSTTVCGIAGSSIAQGRLNVQDVTDAAVVSNRQCQFNTVALSQPFTIGLQVFIWARHFADAQLGVATLLRVPLHSEYTNNNLTPFIRAFPVEATVDDWDIDAPVAAVSSGIPLSIPRPSGNSAMGYVALLSPTRESIVAGTTLLTKRFLLTQVRHQTESTRYCPSDVTPVAGKHFIAAAQPMWVDAGGQYEAGFIQAPVSTAATVISAGGNLTINSAYAHTAVFESLDANGLIERSAPAVPRTTATTANQTATVFFSNLQMGMRWLRCKIYRTLANGSTFYLVGSVDASPAMDVVGVITFVDTYADTDIIQNEPLYTQVGQELATSQFPACSFAATGNARLLCAGGFNANVGHFSKQFTPHICPEFCDDDAFRVRLPSAWTGAAYLDSWVAFTREGIYTIAGDGPDGSGNGFFAPANRLPYALGCIERRSVVACEVGVFFQSARGLELLPRGFGPPVPMDQVQDTIEAYPLITSARAFFSSADGRQMVRWTALATDTLDTPGVVITFDVAFKVFTVDSYAADYPAAFQAEWEGEPVLAPGLTLEGSSGATHWHPFRVQDSSFDDEGLTIAMSLETGDVRPWGLFAHGVINRIGLFGSAKTACTLSVTTTTEHGARTATKAYSGAGNIALDVALGKDTLRDVNSLRVALAETSAVEGVTLTGLVIEHDRKNQGFRLLQAGDRIT